MSEPGPDPGDYDDECLCIYDDQPTSRVLARLFSAIRYMLRGDFVYTADIDGLDSVSQPLDLLGTEVGIGRRGITESEEDTLITPVFLIIMMCIIILFGDGLFVNRKLKKFGDKDRNSDPDEPGSGSLPPGVF